jgi:HPt (histidine-containing phosphotransfer) domain-containing protein
MVDARMLDARTLQQLAKRIEDAKRRHKGDE